MYQFLGPKYKKLVIQDLNSVRDSRLDDEQ